MNILAITIGSYPYGGAASNRHLAYLRGLALHNNKVRLVSLAPASKQSSKSKLKNTDYYGVNIKYTSPFLYPHNTVARKLNFVTGALLGLFHLTVRKSSDNEKKVLILLITTPILLLVYLYAGKLFGYKVVHERTEFPFLGNRNKLLLKFYEGFIIPKLDGIFVITFSLKEYFKRLTVKKVFVLPMSVETDRFNGPKASTGNRYIAYCGSMYTDKDGVPDLISAFNLVASKDKAIQLLLIGDNSDSQRFQVISGCIKDSLYSERIRCTGHTERNEIPDLLINAEILALARPDNIQARGGFPTKLGEYLATGNPVVITDVGEHSRYLADNVSACLVKPGDQQAFANRILFLLQNPEKAKEIGLRGKEVAKQYFDYKSQSEQLSNYFHEL